MRVGVVGFEPQCPGEVCLYSASGLEAAKWDIAAIHERGQDVFCRFPYDRSDEDWRELVEIAAPFASHFELGNEPGNWLTYFKRVPTLANIVWSSGRKAVLAAARSENTVGYLMAAGRSNTLEHVDGVAIHPYAPSPRQSLRIVERARFASPKWLRLPARLPIHITEIGWGTSAGKFTTTEHGQKEKLESFFRLMRDNSERLNVETCLWFQAADTPLSVQPRRWWHSTGLVRTDGTKRPAFHALEAATLSMAE